MKTKNVSKTESDLKSKIKEEYIDFVLTEGKNPGSIYHFCKKLEISEAEFYKHFNSFERIASDIWTDLLQDVIQKLENTGEYASFGVREKILSFFYAVVEQMKTTRSYIAWSSKGWLIPGKSLPAKKAVEQKLEPFFENLMAEGYQTGELADRKKISDFYPKAMVIQFWFILEFWLKDESPDFEDTDAAIEKAVNLGFDLMQENSLDKAFDLAKFLWGRAKSK
jgi:hypothetical protein